MAEPLISIIVPVYNAQSTLARCVESLLAQTYVRFELILIDDGSTDCSGKLCDQYALQDKRVRVFHQVNQGVSAARNKGIDEAKGDYVSFVDSDDYVNDSFLSGLIDGEIVDFVVEGYISDEVTQQIAIPVSSCVCQDREAIRAFLHGHLDSLSLRTPWAKLFNLHVIKRLSLRFDCRFSFGEDTFFVYSFLLQASSLRSIASCDYIYRYSPNWDKKYNRSIQKQYISFQSNRAALDALCKKYGAEFQCAKDQLTYIYTRLFLRYMQQTSWFEIDQKIINSFFFDANTIYSIKRLTGRYKKMIPLYGLFFLRGSFPLFLYAKSLGILHVW